MTKRTFDKIAAGLTDAIAYAKGDHSRAHVAKDESPHSSDSRWDDFFAQPGVDLPDRDQAEAESREPL